MKFPSRTLAARLPYVLLFAIVLLNLIALRAELSVSRIDLNDNVSHFLYAERMAQAIERGGNPLDFWVPEISFGYPVLRTYQPLAYWVVVLPYFAIGKSAALITVFTVVRYLSVALLPVSFFFCARLLTLAPSTSLAAALLAPLISTNGLYGIEYGSYIWAGSGLFPQAIATHLLLITIGLAFRALRRGAHVALTGLLLGLTFLAHFVFGYMGGLTLVLFALLPDANSKLVIRIRRLLLAGAVAFFVAAFQLLSLFTDGPLINHSRWELAWKWDSFGASSVLTWLFSGDLLDHGRFPMLSLLALLGLAAFAWQRSAAKANRPQWVTLPPEPAHLAILSGAALWLVLFCGRPTWGPLLLLLGIGGDVQLHRFLTGAQVFLVLLASIGLSIVWQFLYRYWRAAGAVAGTAIILFPVVRERSALLANNESWGRQNLSAYDREKGDLEAVLANVKAAGGRVYPGLAAQWGGKFTVGNVPIYGFLCPREIPAVAFLYHSMALPGDLMVRFNEFNDAHYRLFGIRRVIADGNPVAPFLKPLEQHGRFRILEPPPASVYFQVIDVPYSITANKNDFYDLNDRWLASDWVQKGQHLGLDFGAYSSALNGLPRIPAGGTLPAVSWVPPPGSITAEKREGETYRATADVARPSYILFRMTYHPNWRATVDNRNAETVMVSPGFAAIAVTPGKHEIVFRYEADGFRTAVAALGMLAALGAVQFTRGRL